MFKSYKKSIIITVLILIIGLIVVAFFIFPEIIFPNYIKGDIKSIKYLKNSDTFFLYADVSIKYNHGYHTYNSNGTRSHTKYMKKCVLCKAIGYFYDPYKKKVLHKIEYSYSDIPPAVNIYYFKNRVFIQEISNKNSKSDIKPKTLIYDEYTKMEIFNETEENIKEAIKWDKTTQTPQYWSRDDFILYKSQEYFVIYKNKWEMKDIKKRKIVVVDKKKSTIFELDSKVIFERLNLSDIDFNDDYYIFNNMFVDIINGNNLILTFKNKGIYTNIYIFNISTKKKIYEYEK